jgi:hypothetical protein
MISPRTRSCRLTEVTDGRTTLARAVGQLLEVRRPTWAKLSREQLAAAALLNISSENWPPQPRPGTTVKVRGFSSPGLSSPGLSSRSRWGRPAIISHQLGHLVHAHG